MNDALDSGRRRPKVSVVTTVLNRAAVLEQAILSVLGQTYPNIEYIVIDGASTDGTLDVIARHAERIACIRSEPDAGIYDGMNKGLALATGEYVIFLNSDDWYFPEAIETLVAAAQAQRCDVVCGLAVEVGRDGAKIGDIPAVPYGDNVRLRMPLRHETMLVRKSLYDRVGHYDASYKIIADLKLTQKLFEMGVEVLQLDAHLMAFRNSGVSSGLSPKLIAERRRLLGEQFPDLSAQDVDFLAHDSFGQVSACVSLIDKYPDNARLGAAIHAYLDVQSRLHIVDDAFPFQKSALDPASRDRLAMLENLLYLGLTQQARTRVNQAWGRATAAHAPAAAASDRSPAAARAARGQACWQSFESDPTPASLKRLAADLLDAGEYLGAAGVCELGVEMGLFTDSDAAIRERIRLSARAAIGRLLWERHPGMLHAASTGVHA